MNRFYKSRAWYFGLESMIPVSRKLVSPMLVGFADRVQMRPKYDVNSTKSFALWDQSPGVNKHMQYARLDKIYSFGIQKTSYKVELTAMWYPNQIMPVWGLAIRHTEWAVHLAELERLSVGSQASWGDVVSTFLPDDGVRSSVTESDLGLERLSLNNELEMPPRDGIRILMEKLMQLSEIVSSVTAAEGGVSL
ncbi:hypothetical protein N0V83_007210 [Neocucurbitaria cava]|uniref:DUF7905 domain-containing protein n=1 Tax=Neocucurbitaria cava TaxID=798079 RepID=A0A9W8Y6H9_9PLEO|nr:hypothetical protein N0V83_007210 [Neocucurbitaria cava]